MALESQASFGTSIFNVKVFDTIVLMPASKTKIIIIPGIFKREVFLEKFKEKLNNSNVDVEIYVMKCLEEGMYLHNEQILKNKIIST
ncbi:MAG: hypothetical protein WA152_01460 [Microgenomates group bacterium]